MLLFVLSFSFFQFFLLMTCSEQNDQLRLNLKLCCCPCSSLTIDCCLFPCELADDRLCSLPQWLRSVGCWIADDPLDIKWLITRAMIVLIQLAFIAFSIYYWDVYVGVGFWFIYLTHWANVTCLIYFIISFVITLHAYMYRDQHHPQKQKQITDGIGIGIGSTTENNKNMDPLFFSLCFSLYLYLLLYFFLFFNYFKRENIICINIYIYNYSDSKCRLSVFLRFYIPCSLVWFLFLSFSDAYLFIFLFLYQY